MSVTVSSSLIGREEELGPIDAFLGDARDGVATLLLEGEAGIGKTTLWCAGVEPASSPAGRSARRHLPLAMLHLACALITWRAVNWGA